MPIVNVKALPQKDPTLISKALKNTCVAIAKFYGCDACHVWATWEEIKPNRYLEGEIAVEIQPAGTHPPMVQLTCLEGSSNIEIEELLKIASATLAEGLALKDNIFMTYHEACSGKIIAGSNIVRKSK